MRTSTKLGHIFTYDLFRKFGPNSFERSFCKQLKTYPFPYSTLLHSALWLLFYILIDCLCLCHFYIYFLHFAFTILAQIARRH